MIPVERDPYSAPFFDAAAEGTLLLRYSPSSGEWSEPAAQVCSVTQATDLEWRPAAGTGQLVTWTIKPGRLSTPDTVVGIVELAEGPWLTVPLDIPPASLCEGLPIRVTFVRPEDSEPLPIGTLERS
jgi:uncharacterized OB-fold protein